MCEDEICHEDFVELNVRAEAGHNQHDNHKEN